MNVLKVVGTVVGGIALTLLLMLMPDTVHLHAQETAASEDFNPEDYADKLLGHGRRDPLCMVDENGLPRRVVIVRNGVGLFKEPESGAERLRTLSLYERLFLYVSEHKGYSRLGADPWDETPTGWVPTEFCLPWDTNELVYLDGRSVSEGTVIHIWSTEEDALDGDPAKAIYTENISRASKDVGDLFLPVLRKDKTGTLYKLGFLHGGSAGALDEHGQELTQSTRQQIAERITHINLAIVIDATGSMSDSIENAKAKAAELIVSLNNRLQLPSLIQGEEPIQLTARVGLVAFRDSGDEFEVKRFVGLTSDQELVQAQLSSLTAAGGGDRKERVQEAVDLALEDPGFQRGALNVITLIGDAEPHHNGAAELVELGRRAKSQFVKIDALLCGDDSRARKAFGDIATASGGSVQDIKEADSVIDRIMADVKARAAGIPIEKEIVESAIQQNTSIRNAARGLGMSEQQARMMHRFLIARGADVAETGLGFRSGWVKVRPGADSRFQLFVSLPRWKMALHLSSMLGLSDRVEIRKDLARNASALVRSFLTPQAGDEATAGIDKSGRSVAERAASVPKVSPGVIRGEAGVERFNKANMAKIRKLLAYWAQEDAWDFEHIWVPHDLLP